MKVTEPDGDVWNVRVRMLPALPPLPRFRDRSKRIGSLGPPHGVAEAHYRLELRGGVVGWLIMVWPLVVLGQLIVNLGMSMASLSRRISGREPWFIVATQKGREKRRRLRWATSSYGEARRCAREIVEAFCRGKGLYEVEGASLLDPPLFERNR